MIYKKAIPEQYRSQSQQQALAHLVEECGEVVAIYGKLHRFGLDSVNPTLPPEERVTNQDLLLSEINDLELALSAFRTFSPKN